MLLFIIFAILLTAGIQAMVKKDTVRYTPTNIQTPVYVQNIHIYIYTLLYRIQVYIINSIFFQRQTCARTHTHIYIYYSYIFIYILYTYIYIYIYIYISQFVKCERQLAGRLTIATKLYYKDKRYKTFMDQVQKYVSFLIMSYM